MKLSQLFTKTTKEISRDEKSVNAQLLERAGFVKKEMAGVYTYLPLGFRVLKKIENIIREEMNAIGGQEILMPTLTSIENYKTTGRENIDVLFKTELHTGAKFVLNQSHEEVVVPLLKSYISSYKDLPKYVYQIQNKFRNEPRAKSGLLRGREFIMKDLYSFHTDEADFEKYYQIAKKAYLKLFKRMGLEAIYTYASGGTFSKYSHEFQVLTEAGEDEIHLCEKCKVAVNKEIIEDLKHSCPECGNKKLVQKKSIEVGNIFPLKDKFSKAFDLKYKDKEGKDQLVIMGCYGIGLSRAMGTVVEVHHDDKGIVWPESVTPFKVQLIEIRSQKTEVRKNAEKIYQELTDNNIEVLYDDRDVSAGQKFADCDLIGCPYRIVISEKTLKENSVEVKKRDSKKSELVKIDKIIDQIK